MTLSHIYFPELKAEAGRYGHVQLSARLEIEKCSLVEGKVASDVERLECLSVFLKQYDPGDELDALMQKVELVAQTL